MSKDYARGYTDALSHVGASLSDLIGQLEAVTEQVLEEVFEDEETEKDGE